MGDQARATPTLIMDFDFETSQNLRHIYMSFRQSMPNEAPYLVHEILKALLETNTWLGRPVIENQGCQKSLMPQNHSKSSVTSKLDRENWHIWVFDFAVALATIPGATDTVLGDIGLNRLPYKKELDNKVSALLYTACEPKSVKNFRYIFNSKKEWSKA